MSISQLYPAEGPTLNLNFAGSRTLDPRITFTRTQTTSNGSTYTGRDGLIKYAGPDEPRFDHRYVSGDIESLGLLIEEQSTNLLTGSDDFGPLYWSKLNSVGVSTNVTTSPDETTNADKFVENTDTSHKVLARSFTLTASTTYTFSIFVKSAERSNIFISLRKSDYSTRFGGFFNLTTKTFSGETAAGGTLLSSSIIEYTNNWFRLTITGDIGANTAAVTTLYHCDTNNDIGYAGNGTSGIFVWGAQLEQKSFATSYIPTEGSTKTRNADNASITGSNFTKWYNQTGYTIFTRHIAPPVTQSGPYPRVFNITTTASGDANRLNYYHTPLVVGSYRVGMSVIENNAITQVDLNTTLSQGLVAKMASRFAENNSALSLNGTIIGTDTNCSINSVTRDILTIGSNINGSYLNSTISQLIYYPYPVSNSQLISLTR